MNKLTKLGDRNKSCNACKWIPVLLDDWLVPGVPIKRRLFYLYMRYRYSAEYLASLISLLNPSRKNTPHIIKRKTIREYSKRLNLRVLVETGTYLGDMISALSRDFDDIYSLELHKPLYEKACLRFNGFKNIHLYFGDSAIELEKILDQLEKPALFWLDAHYSGVGTARGPTDSPILTEINKIFRRRKNHVILIDDASDFNGKNGYPQKEFFLKYLLENRLNYDFLIQDNIIILKPNEAN